MFPLLLTLLLVDDDPLAAQLKTAKEEYAQRLEALKEPTLEWFEAETSSRKGKRALVAELAELRTYFEKNGEPPPLLPRELQQRYAEVAKDLEGWYATAVREYRRARLDVKADAAAKEWLQFRINGRGTIQPEIRDGEKCLIIARCSGLALTVDSGSAAAVGAVVIQQPADERDETQHWLVVVQKAGTTPLFSFQSRRYRLWMQVGPWPYPNGAPIVLAAGEGNGRDQRWLPIQRGAWLGFRGAESGRMLGIPEGNPRAGTRLIQWVPTSEDAQRFRILPVRITAK